MAVVDVERRVCVNVFASLFGLGVFGWVIVAVSHTKPAINVSFALSPPTTLVQHRQ